MRHIYEVLGQKIFPANKTCDKSVWQEDSDWIDPYINSHQSLKLNTLGFDKSVSINPYDIGEYGYKCTLSCAKEKTWVMKTFGSSYSGLPCSDNPVFGME